MYQDIHYIGLRIKTEIKNMFKNHGLRHRPIGMAHEILQQSEFTRLQFYFFAAQCHFTSDQIQGKISLSDPGQVLPGRA